MELWFKELLKRQFPFERKFLTQFPSHNLSPTLQLERKASPVSELPEGEVSLKRVRSL